MRADWEREVKEAYPDAVVVEETTYGKCRMFTCRDSVLKKNLGPTTFDEDAAWKYAAERLGK